MDNINLGTNKLQKEGYTAFIPNVFPPIHGLPLTPQVEKKHAEAMRLVGKLDGITQLLPDKDFFLYMFIRKDASSSSQIEGTQATMMDAIEAESQERPSGLPADVDDIIHYIEAVNYGLVRNAELPLSLRLIKELHKVLMTSARKTHLAFPGEFRTTQNWIAGTSPSNARYVPPPVTEMKSSLDQFERFIHAEDNFLPLIKAGMLHAQFETIHPFVDGNGRTGRMLITMYLWHSKLLEMPVLYLSDYFRQHQQLYYEKLDGYHAQPSKYIEWLDFFLDGVIETSKSAIKTCEAITQLREIDMSKAHQLGKSSAEVTVKILRNLYRRPNVGIADIVAWSGYTRQGAYKVISKLVEIGILNELKLPGGIKYGQRYVYKNYYDLFLD